MTWSIRACIPADLEALVALCADHAAYERAAYDKTGKLTGLRQLLFSDTPGLFCLIVAAEDGEPVGYASYTFEYSTWSAARFLYLDCLYLVPEYRGLGIGNAVMQRIVAIAREQGCVNVQWQTPDFNEGAIRFYRRLGAVSKNKLRFYILLEYT
jgi:GNAT superfamily N-acetyltransferase